MKKLILFMIILILFCGCDSSNDTTSKSNGLDKYEGEWIVSKLIAPPKVSLTAYGHAMENSHIVGEKVIIKDRKVIFKGETSHFDKETQGKFSDFKLQPYYDNDISKITGGNYSVTDIKLKDENGKGVSFGLFIRQDGQLLLLVGEKYIYEGFYELTRAEERRKELENEEYKEKSTFHSRYKGEYEIGALRVASTLGNITGEDAKLGTTVSGDRIKIDEYTVEYDGDIFYIDSDETFCGYDIVNYFFATSEDAEYLCPNEENRRFGSDIRFFRFATEDYKKRLSVVIKDDKDIMLGLPDKYRYIGFYELL